MIKNINLKDLGVISQITENLYLSGIVPLNDHPEILNTLQIFHILCLVPRRDVLDIHRKIMNHNLQVTIVYIPYADNIQENLWKENKENIEIHKNLQSLQDHDQIVNWIKFYQDKPMIEAAYHYIDACLCSGQKILVHCIAGVSRSASILIYYLMRKYYYSFDKSLKTIKNIRSIVNPNMAFQMQLRKYDREK
jgi:protein-tyrosine phosphatase